MSSKLLSIIKNLSKGIGLILVMLVIGVIILVRTSRLHPPLIEDETIVEWEREKVGEDHYQINESWLKLNRPGMWEMYLEGSGFERGVKYGKLASELVVKQEEYFVEQIHEIVPSKRYLNFLKYLIFVFNRNLDKHIPLEYLQEIHGVSMSASEEFNFIGSNYERILNYHAAHDIGHALNEYMKVGCSSVAVWGEQSEDGELLIGRNFDFFVGEDFAKEKIVCFVKPDKGIPFAMITWGGMIGAVSGMNKEGLTITINAAKSDLPRSAATPISILAREILQYASTIDEAFEIAEKRKTFVSESILIGSKKDQKTAIIEKSPKRIGLYGEDDNDIICTNHYQGNLFEEDVKNEQFKKESSTVYRYNRIKELVDQYESLDYREMALILRDRSGVGNEVLGMGNEFALNQLIAHHSIIFKPEENLFWVSSYPYQLGEYIAYDLDEVFSDDGPQKDINIDSLEIGIDSFYLSDDYQSYIQYLDLLEAIGETDDGNYKKIAEGLINSNPNHYLSYKLAGDLYFRYDAFNDAIQMYENGLQKNGIPQWDIVAMKGAIELSNKNRVNSK